MGALPFCHKRHDSSQDAAFRRWRGSLDFSWDFRREGGRFLERFDPFYISDWATCRGGQARVIVETTLSDHVPIILALDTMTHSLAL